MDEPDLSTWLQDWRRAAQREQGFDGIHSLDPVIVPIDDEDWVTLSATASPDVLRLDIVLDADLADEVVPWLVRQILHWGFDHPYAESALQFALAPDATLVAFTHLRVVPEDDAATLTQRIRVALDQAEDAWSQILVDALLKTHLETQPSAGEPPHIAA